MVPIRLTLEGLYSYQKKQVVDFERLTQAQLFGIFGATGSGKSSILEAITLALYGECERLNRNNRNYNLMNLRSGQLSVDFIFSLSEENEKRYRFAFSGKRNKKQFDKTLYQRQAYEEVDGTWKPLEMDTAEPLIGLGYEHFKRTIIIPQGKFREFLDMKDKERSDMLNQVFGLDKYKLSPQVRQLIQKNDKNLAHHQALLQQFVEITEEGIASLRKELAEMERQQQQGQQVLGAKRKQIGEWEKLKDVHDKLQALYTQIRGLEENQEVFAQRDKRYKQYVTCLNLFREPLSKQDEYGREIRQLAEAIQEEKEMIIQLTKDLQGSQHTLKEVSNSFAERHHLLEKAVEWRKIKQLKAESTFLEHLGQRRKKGLDTIEGLKTTVAGLKQEIQEAESAIRSLKKEQPNTQEILAIQEWLQKQQHLTEQKERIRIQSEQLESEIRQSVKKKKDLLQPTFLDPRQYDLPAMQIAALFQEEIRRKEERIQEVATKQLEAQLKQKLGALSQNLREGEPCPLCGAVHHPNPLDATTLDRQLEHLTKYQQNLKGEIDTLVQTAPLLMEMAEQAIGIRRRKQDMEAQLKAASEALRQHETARPVFKDPINETAFGALQERFSKIGQQVEEQEVHLEALRTRLQEEEQKIHTYQEKLTEIQEEYHSRTGKFKSEKETLKHLFFSDHHAVSDTVLEEKALEEERAHGDIETLYKQVQARVEEKQAQLKTYEGKQSTKEDSYKELTQKAARLSQEVLGILNDSDFETLNQVREILGENLNIDAEREAIQQYQKACATAEAQRIELEQQLGEDTYDSKAHQALEIELADLQASQEALAQRVGIHRHKLEEQVQQLEKKKEQEKIIGQLQERGENLKLMQNLFRGDAFVRYVSSAYMENLCTAANERFMRLTRNALSLEVDEHNQFHIRDWLNDGRRRSARTLSGGQSFQAALCLALALSDQVQQQVLSKQKFFFLDEGFGSLDKDSLRLIFQTLQSLQKENRIVGVISHVEELQQEIDTYLHIHNDPELGSMVHGSWELGRVANG